MRRERKIFSTVLLVCAAICVAMSAMHIELSRSGLTTLVMRGGAKIADPLVATIRRHTSW